MLLTLLACTPLRNPPETVAPAGAPAALTWDAILAEPGPLTLESTISAHLQVDLDGLLNLEHPDAAHLENRSIDAILPVHVVTHPAHGFYLIDSGATDPLREDARGLLKLAAGGIDVVDSTQAILARQEAPFAGVLVTHAHLDHVLGMGAVPPDVPVVFGPGEFEVKDGSLALQRRTFENILGDKKIQTWPIDQAVAIDPLPAVLDILGDGSLWAIYSPGHTPGSMAYLARTVDGPVLFLGDTSHTIWGWENGVEPGGFTMDHATNRESLGQLKALVEAHPEIQVFTGHEMDGEGTGVD